MCMPISLATALEGATYTKPQCIGITYLAIFLDLKIKFVVNNSFSLESLA